MSRILTRTREMFSRLDWRGDFVLCLWRVPWRIALSIAGCSALSYAAWWAAYPVSNWFLRLWASVATGCFAGLVIGAVWQLRDERRWGKTSGVMLVVAGLAWCAFSVMALISARAALSVQEARLAELKALAHTSIREVIIRTGRRILRVAEEEQINTLKSLLAGARSHRPGHQPAARAYCVEFRCDSKSTEYEVYTVRVRPMDAYMTVRAPMGREHIAIPGLGKWLTDAEIEGRYPEELEGQIPK